MVPIHCKVVLSLHPHSSCSLHAMRLTLLAANQVRGWYAIRDSNPELTGYKPGTLTVELMAHKLAVSSFIPFRIITDHLATPYDI